MNSELKPKIRFKGFTDDWEQRKLKDIYKFQYGEYNNNPDNGGIYPIYGANGIIGGYTRYNTENSVIIGHMGEYAGSVLWGNGKVFVTYNGTISEPKDQSFNSKFGYYMLFQKEINKICAGSGLPFLSYEQLNKIDVSYPNLIKEQEDISSLLTNIDNLITLHQHKCDKLIELKKSLLGKMFPQNNSIIPEIRFKGFTDDWEQRKLSDNLKNIQTGTNLLGSVDNLGTPLLKMGNIQRGYFTTDKLEFLKDYSSIEKENIANFGDFFFNTRNTLELVGKGATWFGISGKYAFNSNIARFTFEGINTTFFNYLYNTESLLKQVHSRATGTTSVAAIYPQSLNTIEYMLPTYDEQSKIGNLLLDLDNLITLHQRKHDKLNKIKQSLLNDMFV